MNKISPWRLLRGGKLEQEQGLNLIRQAFARCQSGSEIMELGTALLWLGLYQEAHDHFQKAITEKPRKAGDGYYGMAGVAKWCLGQEREAVTEWVAGLKAKYARTGGLGASMPLLLFFASKIRPELYDESAARKLMVEKSKDGRIQYWPGPILQWILGQIDEGELRRHCQGRHELDLKLNLWKVEFYRTVRDYKQLGPLHFKEAMAKLTDVNQPEWKDETLFLARIWGEEFFLARYEATGLHTPSL